MREKEIKVAKQFGVLDRIEEFEKKLLAVDHVVDVEFDLDGFLSDIRQVIFLPKYDIPVTLPDYYDVRKNVLNQVLNVAKEFGLKSSGDRIEDYGEHFYIVRECDDTWVLQRVQDITQDSNVKEWYEENYPSDDVGATLNDDATFADVYNALSEDSEAVYNALGGSADTVVRERVFAKLAEIYGVDYDVIYYKWLGREPVKEPEVIDLSEYENTQIEVAGYSVYRKPLFDEAGKQINVLFAAVKEGVEPFAITYAQAKGFVPIEEPSHESPAERTVGIYGDEIVGKDWTSTEDIVKYLTGRGLKVSDIKGNMESGWEMNVTGTPSKLYTAIVHTIPGYNCNSVDEFIDEYAIDDFVNEKSNTVDEVLADATDRSKATGSDEAVVFERGKE